MIAWNIDNEHVHDIIDSPIISALREKKKTWQEDEI